MVGDTLQDWMRVGFRAVEAEEDHLDALNVFPVPDGDTGHNMVATLRSALDPIFGHQRESLALGNVWTLIADGALTGARGNSGVILSQILAGFAAAAEGQRVWESQDLKRGFLEAARRARQQVVNPVEGTILTVADALARGATDGSDLVSCLREAVMAGQAALGETTRLLPALQGTGQVDAGALGYLTLVKGWLEAALGEAPAETDVTPVTRPPSEARRMVDTIRYFYDVEALLYHLQDHADETLHDQLARVGDSIVLAPGVGRIKVHVHTDQPVRLMEVLTSVGDIQQMEWFDMRWQVGQKSSGKALTIVARYDDHALFGEPFRTVVPEDGQDQENTLWIDPGLPLTRALAAPSLGTASQALLEYESDQPWESNRRRLATAIANMRSWWVDRMDNRYRMGEQIFETRDALAQRLRQEFTHGGMVTVYLSQHARGEEAQYWQEALNAELVQVAHRTPWMEIVGQP